MSKNPLWTPNEKDLATYTRADETQQIIQEDNTQTDPSWCQHVSGRIDTHKDVHTGKLVFTTYFRKCSLNPTVSCQNFNNKEAVATCPIIKTEEANANIV
jgi:hypothetical protein